MKLKNGMSAKYRKHVNDVLEFFVKTLEENRGGVVEDEFLRLLDEYGQVCILDIIDGLSKLYIRFGYDMPKCLEENYYSDAYFWIDVDSIKALGYRYPKCFRKIPKFSYVLLKD